MVVVRVPVCKPCNLSVCMTRLRPRAVTPKGVIHAPCGCVADLWITVSLTVTTCPSLKSSTVCVLAIDSSPSTSSVHVRTPWTFEWSDGLTSACADAVNQPSTWCSRSSVCAWDCGVAVRCGRPSAISARTPVPDYRTHYFSPRLEVELAVDPTRQGRRV